jgi:hypothetical protein
MPKQHQILAIEGTIRAQTAKDLTAAHHGLKKEGMLSGQFREYQPLRDDGIKLPTERTSLQVRVPEVIRQTQAIMEKQFDIVACRDWANCNAYADVTMPDGTVILTKAPAPYLLWLEKQVTDLHTFVSALPTLPADTEWEWDANQNCWRNKHEIKTARTEKIEESLVLLAPTKEHPGQATKVVKDVISGYWTTHKYSGALPIPVVKEMKDRAEELLASVKLAREKANQVEAPDQKVGAKLLAHIFGSK